MFNYTIEVIQEIMTCLIVLGLVFGYAAIAYNLRGQKLVRWGAVIGAIAAAVMAIVKNTTSYINPSFWNSLNFKISVVVFIIFIVLLILEKKLVKVNKIVQPIALAVILALMEFYALPDAMVLPYDLYVAEGTFFTSEYIVNLMGILIGYTIVIVAGIASDRIAKYAGNKTAVATLIAALSIHIFKAVGSIIRYGLTKATITKNDFTFGYAKFVINNGDLLICLTLAVVSAVSVILLVRSLNVNEPYSNPAEHRKIRAKWRFTKRWAVTVLICSVLSIILITVVENYLNQTVTLAEAEAVTAEDDGCIHILSDQVNDGHLHRFAYTTEDGVVLRIIVIKKPNANAYGVGMDACDVCGETGYYEDDGKVICNRCMQEIAITTIGFKGGCNPKVFDYTYKNNEIIIPVENILQYKNDFK